MLDSECSQTIRIAFGLSVIGRGCRARGAHLGRTMSVVRTTWTALPKQLGFAAQTCSGTMVKRTSAHACAHIQDGVHQYRPLSRTSAYGRTSSHSKRIRKRSAQQHRAYSGTCSDPIAWHACLTWSELPRPRGSSLWALPFLALLLYSAHSCLRLFSNYSNIGSAQLRPEHFPGRAHAVLTRALVFAWPIASTSISYDVTAAADAQITGAKWQTRRENIREVSMGVHEVWCLAHGGMAKDFQRTAFTAAEREPHVRICLSIFRGHLTDLPSPTSAPRPPLPLFSLPPPPLHPLPSLPSPPSPIPSAQPSAKGDCSCHLLAVLGISPVLSHAPAPVPPGPAGPLSHDDGSAVPKTLSQLAAARAAAQA